MVENVSVPVSVREYRLPESDTRLTPTDPTQTIQIHIENLKTILDDLRHKMRKSN